MVARDERVGMAEHDISRKLLELLHPLRILVPAFAVDCGGAFPEVLIGMSCRVSPPFFGVPDKGDEHSTPGKRDERGTPSNAGRPGKRPRSTGKAAM